MNRHGAALVEYALVLPVALLFVTGVIDCGRVLWNYTTLYHAAEAGARCGAIDQINCATATQIRSYAASQAYGLTIAPSAFTAVTAACGMSVTGQQSFSFLIPWFAWFLPGSGPGTVTLTVSACYPK